MFYTIFIGLWFSLTTLVWSQTMDLQSMTAVDHNWLEVGIEAVDDRSWTTVRTKNQAWTKPTSIFISLPEIGGTTFDHSSNRFLAPKLKNVVVNGDNTVSFSVKLTQANDSACLKTWYFPQYLSSKIPITYTVVEQGVYQLNDTQFIIGNGPITRANADSTASVSNGNAVRIFYPENCNGQTGTCVHSGPDNSRAAISQLQTSVNTIDGGKEFFLYVRIKIVYSRHIQLVLIPHSSLNPDIFTISNPETVAYMVFDTPLNLKCMEGIVLETQKFDSVTSNAVAVPYANTFLYPPGLFGAISTISLTDATVLRQFSNGISSGNFITQEDQCADEQTIHTTPEVAYALVMGEVSGSSSLECKFFVDVASDAPTRTPTSSPTRAPTSLPSATPTQTPTASPTLSPTQLPSAAPTALPSHIPSASPTVLPTHSPTSATTESPTASPSVAPTESPTTNPSVAPTESPTTSPSVAPTESPTTSPSVALLEPMDLQSMTTVTNKWMEIGSVSVGDRSWATVTSKNMAWAKDAVVFISLPDIGGSTYDDPSNVFLAPKLRNIVRNVDNSVSFDVKLVQPNDSACVKTWYVPQYLTDLPISWLVIEKGNYRLNGGDFFIGTGAMTRANADSTATVGNGNAIRIFYANNCNGLNETCVHSGPDNTRAAITQLQTSVNTIDGGKEFFLYVRVRVVFSRHIQLVLIPHSSSDPNIFTITDPETVAYMVFDTPFSVNCIEGISFETHMYTPVTSTAINVNYVYTYSGAPGLFGALSTVSLTDATVLRQFSNGINSGNFITQEDQCFDEQTIHTAQETAYVLVIGEQTSGISNARCQAYNTLATTAPTVAPSAAPSRLPSVAPSVSPSTAPSVEPTTEPTSNPTVGTTNAPTVAPSVVATSSPTTASLAGPFDLQTMTPVTHTWFEVAFTSIDDRRWYTITTQNIDWAKDAVVFVSLPDIGGSTYDDPSNVFLAPKLRNIVRNVDNSVSFDVKLTQANDSTCSKEWHVPAFLSEKIKITWLVMEKGAYSLNGADVFIGTGPITRNSSDSVATVDNGNAVRIFYPENCRGLNETCVHSGPDNTRAAITQLQTSVNTIDGGREFFLYVRVRVVFSRHIQLVLNPHSSSDPSIFTITDPETVAYMVFDTPMKVACVEGIVFETHMYTPVTSDAVNVNYDWTYDYPPGLFGALSTVSLTDATVLRQFSNGINSGNFITQEDQCFHEQTIHTAQETAYVLVIGEVTGSPDDLICYTSFGGDQSITDTSVPTHAPSVAATSAPTTDPTPLPTTYPSSHPTDYPTVSPTLDPSAFPTTHPTASPTAFPSAEPTTSPTMYPSSHPTAYPTVDPTAHPTRTSAPTTQCVDAKIPFKVTKTSTTRH